jgi:hypothetical protein
MNAQGAALFSAPDLQVELEVDPLVCPLRLRLRAAVANRGAIGVSDGVDVAFYKQVDTDWVCLGVVQTAVDLLPGDVTGSRSTTRSTTRWTRRSSSVPWSTPPAKGTASTTSARWGARTTTRTPRLGCAPPCFLLLEFRHSLLNSSSSPKDASGRQSRPDPSLRSAVRGCPADTTHSIGNRARLSDRVNSAWAACYLPTHRSTSSTPRCAAKHLDQRGGSPATYPASPDARASPRSTSTR